MLSREQIEFFGENGYIKLESVYSGDELAAMSDELDHIINTFATWEAAWVGPWRKEIMTEEEDANAQLVAMHEPQHFSAAWTRAVTKPELADSIGELLDTDAVELHHGTLHAKTPGVGAPFPLHQDLPFYPHEDNRYIDALVHMDDADEESGCIRFLPGSHKNGKLAHIMGPDTSPHLPTDEYDFHKSIHLPAKAGDVVLFTLWTIHGSAVNHGGAWRRIIRLGFRDPRNIQVGGQSLGRPGMMVKGVRPKIEGQSVDVYGNWEARATEGV
jgi:ectoine hydroxylase-related dioxygenase (phytanoyl-CoA dioxygenase family)